MMERMLSAYSVIAEEDRVNSEENARKTAVFENNERMYVEALNQSAIVQEVSTSGDILYANDLTEQIT